MLLRHTWWLLVRRLLLPLLALWRLQGLQGQLL
jgi:hypothetical protein